MFRAPLPTVRSVAARRTFVSTPASRKTVSETVKDVAEKVNRAVGDAALKTVEAGETVSHAAKDSSKPLVDSVKNLAGDASTKASKKGQDLSNTASKAASDVKTEANKVASDAKNAANKH
ncbi:hypothetical protein JCM21900_003172 [Sporobolomyces salmonicolor]